MHLLLLVAMLAHPRLVTLVPSFADDVAAIGAARELAGVSRFTTAPGTASVPVVADFQSVDVEKIVALSPDVVIGIPSQQRMVAPLRRAGIRVVLLPDDTFAEIFGDLREIGALAGRPAQAAAEIAKLQRETDALHARALREAFRPSVFVALGTGPIWTAGRGSYLDTLIRLAGARNAAGDLHAPWGEYSAEALLRAQPDAIVAGDETDVAAVESREPWRSLRAVREGHVFAIADPRIDDALFRPGPNYVEGLRWLIERLSSLSTSTTRSDRSNPNS